MKHYNYERYPLDASLVVLVIEMVKAVIALGLHLAKGGGKLLTKFDSHILVPCAIYVITNNLFFIALFFVSPAVWMVLIQIRLPFLLLIYRLMFKRTTVPAQWVGAVFSVVFMQIEHVRNFMNSVGPALMLAAFSSLLSAVAGVYIEMVLKSGDELWRRQFHLYIGASLMSVVPFFISKYCYGKRTIDVIANHMLLTGLILLSVALSAVHGIATSLVIKKLDNIVRFQLGALIYVFTAVLNKTFFPDKFSLSGWYILSVVLALYSMFIIERKSFL